MLPRQELILSTLAACTTACQATTQVRPAYDSTDRAQRLSQDCAELCQLTDNFVVRGSEHLVYIFRECAELCRGCADELARHEAAYPACQLAVQACRRAEDACRTAYL